MTDRDVVRMFYHDESEWDHVIVDLIGPLSSAAARYDVDLALRRGWRQGPHLELRLHGSPAARGELRDVMDSAMSSYLTENPSERELVRSEVSDREAEVASSQGMDITGDEWQPDNSLVWEVERCPSGSAPTDALVDRFHVASTPVGIREIEATPSSAARSTLAFDLMVATADRLSENGFAAAATSYRSHSEAHLNLSETGRLERRRWAEAFEHDQGRLTARVQRLVSDGHRPQHVREWLHMLTPYAVEARQLAEEGRLALPSVGTRGFSPSLMRASPFHRRIAGRSEFQSLVDEPWFQAYRLTVSLLYLQLSRIGISARRRHLLCHLVARCAEEYPGHRHRLEDGEDT